MSASSSSASVKRGARRSSAGAQIKQQSVADGSSGSLSSPSGQRKSARLQKKKGEKIYLCNDVLYDVFVEVDYVKLGLGVALVSNAFDAMVDNCFKTKKRKLQHRLWIRQVTGEKKVRVRTGGTVKKPYSVNQAELVTHKLKPLPFAKSPPPAGIVAFKSISISYIDATVMAFLELCRPLFNAGIAFQCDGNFEDREAAFGQIWPLFRPHIVKMALTYRFFVRLRQFFGSSILHDCARLRFINTIGIVLAAPPSDDASPGQALFKWLHTPREDGRPKTLTIEAMSGQHKQLEAIKKEFLSATTAASFIVRFRNSNTLFESRFERFDKSFKRFDLSNALTGERLTLRHVVDKRRDGFGTDIDPDDRDIFYSTKFDIWLLERGPDKRDEQQWAECVRERPFYPNYFDVDNVVYVNLNKSRAISETLLPHKLICSRKKNGLNQQKTG